MNEIDDSKKTEYYKELQKILSEEAASVFIMDPMSLVAVKKELKGYEIYPMYVQDMSLVYFEE